MENYWVRTNSLSLKWKHVSSDSSPSITPLRFLHSWKQSSQPWKIGWPQLCRRVMENKLWKKLRKLPSLRKPVDVPSWEFHLLKEFLLLEELLVLLSELFSTEKLSQLSGRATRSSASLACQLSKVGPFWTLFLLWSSLYFAKLKGAFSMTASQFKTIEKSSQFLLSLRFRSCSLMQLARSAHVRTAR